MYHELIIHKTYIPLNFRNPIITDINDDTRNTTELILLYTNTKVKDRMINLDSCIINLDLSFNISKEN